MERFDYSNYVLFICERQQMKIYENDIQAKIIFNKMLFKKNGKNAKNKTLGKKKVVIKRLEQDNYLCSVDRYENYHNPYTEAHKLWHLYILSSYFLSLIYISVIARSALH